MRVETSRPQKSVRASAYDSPLERQDRREATRRLGSILRYGSVFWLATLGLDFLSVQYIWPGHFTFYVVIRVVGFLLLSGSALYLSWRAEPSAGEFLFFELLAIGGSCLCCGIMAIHAGGLDSHYAHGLTAILVARGLAISSNYKRGALTMGFCGALYPAALIGASFFSPTIAAQFHNPASIGVFLCHSWLILVAVLLLSSGGHAFWAIRRKLFETRNIGRYQLKRRIGKGGMGEVWVAYHPTLKRNVAMKIVRGAHSDVERLTRFEHEMRVMSELTHPNTVRVYDSGVTDDGLWYYVMELVEGETLDEIARANGVDQVRAILLLRQVARAVAEAHEKGLVHRDIKPENILVTSLAGEKDFVKVLDFGGALGAEKLITGESTGESGSSFTGTPLFAAPEQIAGKELSPQTDVYALGAVLYFALTGHAPFERSTAEAILGAHMSAAPPLLEGAFDPELQAIVHRCLEKDPSNRFRTAHDFERALAKVLNRIRKATRSLRPPPLVEAG